MTAVPVRYAGISDTNRPVTGQARISDLPRLVAKCHRLGWRRLTITELHDPRHVLATIGPKAEGGGLVWWTEADRG